MTNLARNFPKEFEVKLPDFAFTKTVNIENADKLDSLFEFESVINKHLQITTYSSIIKNIVFVYILLDGNRIRLPTKDYISRLFPKNKTIEVGLNLNYEELLKADNETAKRLMLEKYLWGIENLLSKRKDFDYKRFYDDCAKLLM